jgi:comEA protein
MNNQTGTKLIVILGLASLALLTFVALAHAAPPTKGGGEAVAPAPQGATGSTANPTKPPATTAANSGTVNINTASADELMRLPGVGASRAMAIVAYRTKHGSFGKVEDLARVKRFGRKTLIKLRPYLSVSGPTTYEGKKRIGPTLTPALPQ